jgi:hypothetical protein
MKSACIGRRSQRGVAGLPRRGICLSAALIFPGTIATNKMARQMPAAVLTRGISKPMAPSISKIPATKTIWRGWGNGVGNHLDEVLFHRRKAGAGGKQDHHRQRPEGGVVPGEEKGHTKDAKSAKDEQRD